MIQKTITRNLGLIACLFYLALTQQACSNDDSNKSCSNVFNGLDTSIYEIVYQKDGNLILSEKQKIKMIAGEHIDPNVAFEMIKDHVATDISPAGVLTDNKTKFVTFDILRLIRFYKELGAAGKTPDSLRIYFGLYNTITAGTRPEYIGKTSCILVGVKADKDIYDATKPNVQELWPINIGTLCPPNCSKTTPITDFNSGPVFLKKGATMAGATSW